jgi:hypothetical protein
MSFRFPVLALLALPLAALAEPGAQKTIKVDFRRDVLPVLSKNCFHCHGPDDKAREAKLRLDVREDAIKDRDGIKAIVPGDPKLSEAIVRVTSKDEDEVMPPPKQDKPLSAAEVEILRQWIAQGANYEQHWSFVKPKLSAVPPLPAGAKARGPIDPFVAAKLVELGLTQAPEADRFTLLRRVALDLTGLPPTPEDFAAFDKDTAPGAFERAVDRLMASPHFGEKWARMWLDLARYADSTGYGSDKFRMNVWPYRDWVISAFNRNVPYDQFTLEQLAGDLLPNATTEQIAATAFHRNTMTQTEGGTDDEEYRVAAVKDRVATTMQVWMGLTAGCAQCHSHKFDPISQKEYYQLFAVFNQTEDADREDEAPRLPLSTKAEGERKTAIQSEIAALEKQLEATSPELEAEQHGWEERMSRPIAWQAPKPASIKSSATPPSEWSVQPDGSVLARGASPDKDTVTVNFAGPLKGLTALRIEALPDDSLPAKGPGRASQGNAVLSELQARLVPAKAQALKGRFVRIEHQAGNYVHLAEVQVFSGAENVARKGKASQSSVGYEGAPARAIDGNTDGDYAKNSVSHTGDGDKSPWWEVDLGADLPLDKIVLWNRTDGNTEARLAGATLKVLDAQRQPVFTRAIAPVPDPSAEYFPGEGVSVSLGAVSADFEQKDFAAANALDGKSDTGWAFGGRAGQPHVLVVEFTKSLDVPDGSVLRLDLAQLHGAQHTLGKFRVSVTSSPGPIRELPAEIRAVLALEPTERSAEQRAALTKYFRPLSRQVAEIGKRIEGKKTELSKIKPVELPIMRELPEKKHRKSHMLTKGNFLLPGDEVTGAVPAAFGTVPAGEVNRLALARWILSPDNTLTARVAVNRFWAQIFGTGLVETEEDFGTQGQFPSHPELLDWLAVTFETPKANGGLGWDMKALLKLIVTSQTYRQSSVASDAARQKDPRNRWLSHYPRRRLEAEAIRDQALALSSLLAPKIGGPSVYPPQPDGLWSVAFNGGQNSYPTSKGDDRRRRGIYTFWRRIAPNPTMTTFDAPSRETCTIRRVPTNTPLQAFVTLNDPVFVECAQSLARRIAAVKGDAPARLRWALQLVLARPPSDAQVAALRELYDAELTNYRQRPDEAKKLAVTADLPLPAGADVSELAAWTVVANVLLNLDGVLTKS